jgi:hypothetical protein
MRLPLDDPLRQDTTRWPEVDMRPIPVGPSPEAQIQLATMVEAKLVLPKDTGVNRLSGLWGLPYWRVCLFFSI